MDNKGFDPFKVELDLQGRQRVFSAIVGSRAFNLHTEDSDWDMVTVVLPTFDDLYDNKQYSKAYNLKPDVPLEGNIYDIRGFMDQVRKVNLNRLEVLFADQWRADATFNAWFSEMCTNAELFARMDTGRLYKSMVGFYHSKRKHLVNGTENTQHLVKAYGYDTKQAMHALRLLNILEEYDCNYHNSAKDGKKTFCNFRECIKHTPEQRARYLDIKHGSLSLEKMEELLDRRFASMEMCCRESYTVYEQPQEEKDFIDKLFQNVRLIVEVNLDSDKTWFAPVL